MRRILRDVTWLVILAVGAVVVVSAVVALSVTSAWRWVLAPLLGIGIWLWASTALRSMAAGKHPATAPGDAPDAREAAEGATLYWCEECGSQLLQVTRGSGMAPRHCGTRMHPRTEILH